jgi:hypothetical protein
MGMGLAGLCLALKPSFFESELIKWAQVPCLLSCELKAKNTHLNTQKPAGQCPSFRWFDART